MIELSNKKLSIRKQAKLLGINRNRITDLPTNELAPKVRPLIG